MGTRTVRKQALKRALFFYVWNALVIMGVVVLACGKQSGGLQGGALKLSSKPLTLAVFVPFVAEERGTAHSSLAPALEGLSSTERDDIDVRVFVLPPANLGVSQAVADAFLKELTLPGTAVVDLEGKAQAKFLGKNAQLPAAILLERSGEAVSSAQEGPFEDWGETVSQAGQLLRKRVTLALFGAPWCTECKKDLPAIEKGIQALTARQRLGIRTQLYVTTGVSPSAPATVEIAEQYRNVLHLEAIAQPDPWRWKTFKKYVGGDLLLPGAAVLDPSGNILRSYRAGATTFVPAEIVDFAVRSIP